MQPADQPDKPKRQLPPELAFLNELTNRPEMENEECLVWTRGLLQKIRDNAELMRKHDFDPDLMISRLLPDLEGLERARRDVEEAEEELLHLIADEADAGRAAVDGLERVI